MTAASWRSARKPPTSSVTVTPGGALSPKTSVTEARIVPGDPSGKSTIKFNTRFSRVNPLARNSWPNNGCVEPVTLTSHGKTERRYCSLSPSLPEPANPTSWSPSGSPPSKPAPIRHFGAADLVETLYQALADDSVGRAIDPATQGPDHLRRARVGPTRRHRSPTAVPVRRRRLRTPLAGHRLALAFESWGRFLPEHTTAVSSCSTGCCTTATPSSPTAIPTE
jgi:hypothetical protein